MKKWFYGLFALFIIVNSTQAQEKITLEKIWGGAFRTEGMDVLNAMKHSNTYSVLDYNPQTSSVQIDLYDFQTLERMQTLVSSKDYQDLRNMSDYTFSTDEQKLLIATGPEYIYRRSFTARYYVYDLKSKKMQLVHDEPIQSPSLNADGTAVAFVKNNNIYVTTLSNGKTKAVTTDGKKNHIINGITDWVYEEEFAFVQAYEWNADGTKIAFIKFDETHVPEFSMDVYGEELYPTQQVFKYPKAGEKNSTVSLHIYDVVSGKNQRIQLNQEYYIPRLKWTNDVDVLSVQTLNRRQNDLHLYFVDAKNGKVSLVLREQDDAYVDIHDHLTFLKDNSFIWYSEKEGYNHLYHYDKSGKLINRITSGDWEVTSYYGLDEQSKTIYYQSVENGSTKRDVFQIALDGSAKKQLSTKSGTNKVTFSPDFKYYINQFESNETPPLYTLNETATGREIKTIVSNESLLQKLKNYSLPTKEFFEIENTQGIKLNAYIIKPADFSENKKYPVLMYQYSGPGSQEVADQWWKSNDYWHAMLAEKDYLVVCVDGTGTGLKGARFKKATQLQLGKYEVEDQIHVAKVLGKRPYIDENRIGIWGWSFGGFMSSNCLFQAPEVFKTAIAVAPVTNWRFYDTVYTERFMDTPQENPAGYDVNSPITYASLLKGNYLLIHGTADDNVHVQNAMILINALVHQNKNFEWLIYPDKNHGIYGGKTRLQLYTKMTEYILEKL